MESCENSKSRFEINRDIPSETERNQSNFSASGMALNRYPFLVRVWGGKRHRNCLNECLGPIGQLTDHYGPVRVVNEVARGDVDISRKVNRNDGIDRN